MTENNTFNPEERIISLIDKMGMAAEAEEKVAELRKNIEEQVETVISETVAKNVDPEVLDFVLQRYENVESPIQLAIQIIKHDTELQAVILDELDEWEEQMLEAAKRANG